MRNLALSMMIDSADAVVIGSPVYWSAITSNVRAMLSRKLRVEMGSGPTTGMPALGILVAGGSGNGLVEAMKPLYLLFEKLRWHPLNSFPVTRFNWDRALVFANEGGRDLAAMSDKRRPIPEDQIWTFYNDLRYRSYDRIDERRVLAELIVGALPEVGKFASVASEMRERQDQVETLFQQHRKAEAVPLIDDIIFRAARYDEYTRKFVRVLREAEVRVILGSPGPVDTYTYTKNDLDPDVYNDPSGDMDISTSEDTDITVKRAGCVDNSRA